MNLDNIEITDEEQIDLITILPSLLYDLFKEK
jgi:hypothetical protein